MMNENRFDYLAIDNLPKFEDAFVGVVPPGITTHDDLLLKIEDELLFPSYFGCNWNALYDCLGDFHWVEQFQVVLVHRDLPALPSKQLQIYLEVLLDAIDDWKPGKPHHFRVVFDPSLKNQVALALKGGETGPQMV